MTDILNPGGNSELNLQQSREIPKLDIAPQTLLNPSPAQPLAPSNVPSLNNSDTSTNLAAPQDGGLGQQMVGNSTEGSIAPGVMDVEAFVKDSEQPAAPVTDLQEEAVSIMDEAAVNPLDAPVSTSGTTSTETPNVEVIPEVPSTPQLLPTSEVFGTTPSFGIPQGDIQGTGAYFKAVHQTQIPFDAVYSGRQTASGLDLTLEQKLARNAGLTPEQIEMRELENKFAEAKGQEVQHNNLFQLDSGSAAAYIPQPEQLQFDASPVQVGVAAMAEEEITTRVNDALGRQQLQIKGIQERPFDIYVPQFDNSDLYSNLPTAEELRAARDTRIAQVTPQNAPSTQGISATDNALLENFGNLIGDGVQRGGVPARRSGNTTVAQSIFNTILAGGKNVLETATGLGAGLGVLIQTAGRSAVNLLEGEGLDSFGNAFGEALASGQGQKTQVLGDWLNSTNSGDTIDRQALDFRPLEGQFGDYGSGTLGALFYAMDLPANIILSGAYTVADALDVDKALTGQDYTGNRFWDGVRGRDVSFTQRQDTTSYLTPITRDTETEKKTQTEAISQWGTGFVLDILTGNFGDAIIGAVTRTGREAVRTSGRFASQSLPDFTPQPVPPRPTPQPVTQASLPGTTGVQRALPGSASTNPNMPAPSGIVTPPGRANTATVNPSIPNALQQLDPRLNLNANYRNVTQNGTSYVTPNSNIWEPSAANSLEAQGSNTQLIAQQLVEHNMRNANPNVVGIPNQTVPTAPVAAVRITPLPDLYRRAEVEANVSRQVAAANPTSSAIVVTPSVNRIPVSPEQLRNPQTAARFVQTAIDDGAITVDNATGNLGLTPEVFAERVARQNDLQGTRESLLEVLERPITPEVKIRVESQLARIETELKGFVEDLPASQQTLEVTAVRVADDNTTPVSTVVNKTEEDVLAQVNELLDNEISRLEESLRANGIDPDIASETIYDDLMNATPTLREGVERVVSLAEEGGIPVQKALSASGLPDMPIETLERIIGRQLEAPTPQPRIVGDGVEVPDAVKTADEYVPDAVKESPDIQRGIGEAPKKTPTPINEVQWTRSPLDKKGSVYEVDMPVLDNSWKMKGGAEYIGKGGKNGIGTRYQGIGDFLTNKKEMNMPTVDVDQDGYITFVDGRHRTAYARDNGLTKMPVFVRNPGAVKGRPGWTRRGKVGTPVTPAQVDQLIPVVKQSDLSAPISPVEVQKTSRQATAKRVTAPPIEPKEVQVVKRSNQQLSAIARNTIDPDTGKPIWSYKRPMSTKELDEAATKYGDILGRYGKNVDTNALNAPVKQVEVEKAQPSTGKARKTQISEAAPLNKEPLIEAPKPTEPAKSQLLKEEYRKLQKELRSLEDSGEFSPKAMKKMDKLEVKLSELKEQIDELKYTEEYLETAPVSQKLETFVPKTKPIEVLQESVAKLDVEMQRAGLEAQKLEQRLIDMEPAIKVDREEWADLAHAGRQDIENEFTTREWSGLIDPLDSPNRIQLERPDIAGGVNKAHVPVSPWKEQAKNLGITNPDENSLGELSLLLQKEAVSQGITKGELQGFIKGNLEDVVEEFNNGGRVSLDDNFLPLHVADDGMSAGKSSEEILDRLASKGVSPNEVEYASEIDLRAMYEGSFINPRATGDELVFYKGYENLEDIPVVSTKDLMDIKPVSSKLPDLEDTGLSQVEQAAKDLGVNKPDTATLGQLSTTVKHLALEDGLTNAQLQARLDEYISKAVDRYNKGVKVSGDSVNLPIVKSSPKQLAMYDWDSVDETLRGLGVKNPEKLPQYKKSAYLQYVEEFGMSYETAAKRLKFYDKATDVPAFDDTKLLTKSSIQSAPNNALEVRITQTREALQKKAATINGTTFYHGTKSEVQDLTVLNPREGSSFAELGSGIYLTTSAMDAEHYAKAFIPVNKYPTGNVRTSAVGKVHEVKVKIAQPLDGNDALPTEATRKFNKYLEEVHPDIDYRVSSKTKSSSVLLRTRQAAQNAAGNSVPVSEARMVEIQRVFTDILKSEGYDSMVKKNKDGTLTASVFSGENLKVSRQTPVGDGSVAEGLFSRKYLDDYMYQHYPKYDYTKSNMLKSRLEAEEFLFKETEKAWRDAAINAEDAAGKLAATQTELEKLNRTATRQAADNIETRTLETPDKKLKEFMEDTDNLCL